MSSKRGTTGGLKASFTTKWHISVLFRRWYSSDPGTFRAVLWVWTRTPAGFHAQRSLPVLPLFGEGVPCLPTFREGALYWRSSRVGKAVFLNVAALSWLVACAQVWPLGQVLESQPRSARVPAHVLLWRRGFGAEHFCAHKPVPLVPCFTFPDPVQLCRGSGGYRRGADTSKLEGTLEMLPFLCLLASRSVQHHRLLAAADPVPTGSWPQPSPSPWHGSVPLWVLALSRTEVSILMLLGKSDWFQFAIQERRSFDF